MKPPFFIVGTQRSGTTLLCHMLDTHPELYVLNEFWDLYSHLAPRQDADERLTSLLMSRLGLSEPYMSPDQPSPRDPFDHVEMAFQLKASISGKNRWALKDPRLTYFLEEFRLGYPEAPFVLIVRDPRAVNLSYLTRKWNVANVYHGALLWKSEIERQLSFAREHPEKSHVIKYEELILQPERVLRALCRFLGEEYVDELLNYYRKTPHIELHEGNINITKPLRPSMIDKWKNELSPRQVSVIESLTADTMSKLGYERVGKIVAIRDIHRRFYDAHQEIMTTYWWQRRSRFKGPRDRLRHLLSLGSSRTS